jgi:hypothetical protein
MLYYESEFTYFIIHALRQLTQPIQISVLCHLNLNKITQIWSRLGVISGKFSYLIRLYIARCFYMGLSSILMFMMRWKSLRVERHLSELKPQQNDRNCFFNALNTYFKISFIIFTLTEHNIFSSLINSSG